MHDEGDITDDEHPLEHPPHPPRGNGERIEQNEPPEWRQSNMEQPVVYNFNEANSGVQVDTAGFKPINYFQLFITDELLEVFVLETNRFAEDWKATHPYPKRRSRTRDWTPEMKKYVGITLIMGLIKVPRVQLYWARDHMFSTPLFRGW